MSEVSPRIRTIGDDVLLLRSHARGSMNYLFAMLACGRTDYTRRTLAAYGEFLTPAPSEVFVYDDGGQLDLEAVWPDAWADVPRALASHPTRLGRCAAHAKLWEYAAASEHEHVWVVEDDILLLRPLALHNLAALLDAEPNLVQVALVRCPWGGEIPFGGYIPMRAALGHDWYERRSTFQYQSGDPVLDHYGQPCTFEWIASTVDWTSSPALLRTSLAREVEWPASAGCEGTLGPRIQAVYPDAVSGYWGWAEPWCSHIGMERVAGGHGY